VVGEPLKFDVVVVGSANLDHLIRVQGFPQPGETVTADDHVTALGGKGANQALAAARCGARVAFVGSVGSDDAGAQVVSLLNDDSVDTSRVETANAPTGRAFVNVDQAGMNHIVVAPGANARLRPPEQLPDAAVLLVQLESPAAAVRSAMRSFRGIVVLNPAPSRLASGLINLADVLVPNAVELADLANAGYVPVTAADALVLVRQVAHAGPVVVTLGAQGALVVVGVDSWHVAAPDVDVIDTTGAGDAFCGAFATRLAVGDAILDAARWGVAAGSAAVTKPGAGSAMPDVAQIAAWLPGVTVSRVGASAPIRHAVGLPADI